MIGLFVNELVLRTSLAGDPSVQTLLARVRATCLDAYGHQDLPFERLVEALAPARSLTRAPLFQVKLLLQNAPGAALHLPDLDVTAWETPAADTALDLTVLLRDDAAGGGGLTGGLQYATALWRRASVAALAVRLQQVLTAMVADPAQRVSALPLLTPDEQTALTVASAGPARPVPHAVAAMIAAQAARTPDAIAVVGGEACVSYAALLARATGLAARLRAEHIGAGQIVALLLDRSIDMVAAILGVIHAGAAYVPLDPAFPAPRLGQMLDDARPALLVTSGAVRMEAVNGATPRQIDVTALVPAAADLATGDLVAADDSAGGAARPPRGIDTPPRPWQHDPAYILYTSGSTGRPKGVVVGHGALAALLVAMTDHVTMTPADRQLALTTLSFDIAMLELFLPLCHGATVVVATHEDARDPVRVAALIRRQAITSIQATPTQWTQLVAQDPAVVGGRQVLTGGEALSRPLARALFAAGARVFNVYGPTEATIWASLHALTADNVDARTPGGIPLGRPLANYTTYVVDAQLQLVPPGVVGEVAIGGAGVAQGYLRQPALTAERFMPDAWSGVAGARMYRTGDQGRWRPDGLLDYLGRRDGQVKIRGVRVELGEIEHVLAQHPAVQQGVVVHQTTATGDAQLVAYVVLRAPAVSHARDMTDASDRRAPRCGRGCRRRCRTYSCRAR